MRFNLYNPVRDSAESLADYHMRQRLGREKVEKACLRGPHLPPGRKAQNSREYRRSQGYRF